MGFPELKLKFERLLLVLVFVSVACKIKIEFFLLNVKSARKILLSPSVVIDDLEGQLSTLISKEPEGAKIRSRAQWFEEGEKLTRYFFRLEQTRAISNSFSSLFDENGIEKTSQQDLEDILTRFYQALFTSDSLDMQIQTDIIDALEFSLTDYKREICEGLFTLDELFAALKGLQTGKTPGSDGLSTEVYLCFWDDLGELLLSVLNESFHAGSLAKNQYEGLLRLIYNKDERRLPKKLASHFFAKY